VKPLDVLLTCRSLTHRGGSEMYVRDLALGLARHGQRPSVWCAETGPLADELRRGGVSVIERLDELAAPPDLVHAQQHLELAVVLLRFPGTPAVFTCHAARDAESEPLRWRAVRRCIAVDRATRERLLAAGVPAAAVATEPNAVDLERFRPRPALPAAPRRALVFSNYVHAREQLEVLRDVCAAAGLDLEIIGSESGHPHAAPETALPAYDLVLAKGRCALEAMAVGCAVVLCDATGVGPLVTTANLGELRRDNFGFRCLDRPLARAPLAAEISRYDPAEAARVRDVVRDVAGVDGSIARLQAIYAAVLAEPADPDPHAGLAAAASEYLLRWAPFWRSAARWQAVAEHAAEQRDRVEAARRLAAAELQRALAIAQRVAEEAAAAELRAAQSARAAGEARRELLHAYATRTSKLRERILRLPGLLALYRRLRGRAAERVN